MNNIMITFEKMYYSDNMTVSVQMTVSKNMTSSQQKMCATPDFEIEEQFLSDYKKTPAKEQIPSKEKKGCKLSTYEK